MNQGRPGGVQFFTVVKPPAINVLETFFLSQITEYNLWDDSDIKTSGIVTQATETAYRC
jgi:hypothetical protein